VGDKVQMQILPFVGTEAAEKWDLLFYFLVWSSVFFFVLIVGAVLWCVFRYREKSPNQPVGNILHNQKLEFVWVFIPTLLVLFIFAWGWLVYERMKVPPPSAYDIKVIGKQWLWQFQYDNGHNSIGDLVVPEKVPVRLLMTSEDVIHAFFVPDFRIKSDVVPGMYTTVWFQAKGVGEHDIYCTQYCGTSHAKMLGKVKVVSAEDWQKWKQASTGPKEHPANPVDWGHQLYKEKGCLACHSLDGSKLVGPSFKGIWGKYEEMVDGSKHLVDENYIKEMIENPATAATPGKILKGYPPVMPSFKGLISIEEMNAITEFIKSLKD
jgi:cytochrome c oxidase subunit 2